MPDSLPDNLSTMGDLAVRGAAALRCYKKW